MPNIEIDFDVFKELTSRRSTESMTYNDVIRQLLKLNTVKKVPVETSKPWVVSNTSFPAGTELIADYKGKRCSGLVRDGKLHLSDGHSFTTPSAAAVYITGHTINGWRFWKGRLPGEADFVLLERLRGKQH